MKRHSAVLPVLLGAILLTATGCSQATTRTGFVEQAEAQTGVTQTVVSNRSQTQTVAGLSVSSPFPFVRANERLDTGLQDLSAEKRANIVSYESWDATASDGTQKVVVNRITYTKDTLLSLDAAAEGDVEDIMTGLEHACKPQYQIKVQMVANMPGRYLSLECNLPQEGPVYVESIIFAERETLWFVKVAFEHKNQLATAQAILNSVRISRDKQK